CCPCRTSHCSGRAQLQPRLSTSWCTGGFRARLERAKRRNRHCAPIIAVVEGLHYYRAMTQLDVRSWRAWSDLAPVVLWACAAAVAVFLAMLFRDSAVFGGVYVPQGNDSFYHARRAIDALGARGFYETDMRLHAPDGRL